MKICLDIMGGDYAPKNCLDGAILAAKELPSDTIIVLIGDEVQAKKYLTEQNANLSRFEFVHTTEVLEMGANSSCKRISVLGVTTYNDQ